MCRRESRSKSLKNIIFKLTDNRKTEFAYGFSRQRNYKRKQGHRQGVGKDERGEPRGRGAQYAQRYEESERPYCPENLARYRACAAHEHQ